MKVICPYCNKDAVLVDSSVVYGKSYGNIWLCAPCKAYVGCHKRTNKPLGRLADAELRTWKKMAHQHFDPLWKQGFMTRGEAYQWLAKKMGIPRKKCHIGMFDIDQCKQVSDACFAYLKEEAK